MKQEFVSNILFANVKVIQIEFGTAIQFTFVGTECFIYFVSNFKRCSVFLLHDLHAKWLNNFLLYCLQNKVEYPYSQNKTL